MKQQKPDGETRRNPTIPDGWTVTDADRRLTGEISERLPDRVFDAHAHPYLRDHVTSVSPVITGGPLEVGVPAWREAIGRIVGADRLCGGLMVPFPSRGIDPEPVNRYVLDQVSGAEDLVAALVVTPDQSRATIEALVDANPRVKCLKCYHFFSRRKPDTFNSELDDFLPEWAWQLADERGLAILLHMVRDAALADTANQKAIVEHCSRYPGARLILAHAARGFHAPNTVKGIGALQGLTNVWFDASAVCETPALTAILDTFGPRRLMWGTDFPVSQQRGRCVTMGTGFAWVVTDGVNWNRHYFYGDAAAVGIESTRALLDAADQIGLDRDDLQDVFCDNAMRLFGLTKAPADRTQDLHRRAIALMPGGTQLLSKRPEMFAPGQWPAYFAEARGCEVWDLDGRRFYDVACHGIGASLLGYRDPDVTRAVRRKLTLGSYSILNPPEEVALAELLIEHHPWAAQARFGRTGGEMMSVAVRIARATTDRSLVAVCGYHGWHDWYLAANLGDDDSLRGHLLPGLEPLGVPRELRGTTLPFTYNSREELQKIIDEHGPNLAAVVMEPCRHHLPEAGFLEFVKGQARRAGALLIFDEITIGWRLACGGAHLKLGVDPDIAVFAKALGNGHPIAAVIGTADAMQGAHGSFISSTYWTEAIGPAAALATIQKMQRIDVPAHCDRIGRRVQDAWRRSAADHDLPAVVPECFPALAHFQFEGELSQELKTLYTQLMLERGFLASTSIYVCLAHTDAVIDLYVAAVDEVFGVIAEAIKAGTVRESLKGPVAHSGFQRLL